MKPDEAPEPSKNVWQESGCTKGCT